MWQFIPGTGRDYKLEQNWWYDGRRDVVDSTDAALAYLEKLHKLFDDDWLLALAAYNSGQGTVSRAIRKNRKLGRPTDFWSLDLPRETRSYVPKLLALAKLVDQPHKYGIELYPVSNTPYFSVVDTGSQIDLAEAAQLADIEIEELYRLNPGFNRWATAPSGPHRLLVPVAKANHFEQKLANLPASARMHWQRYTVKSGDSIGRLAQKYHTDIGTIRAANKLRGNMIRVGQALMIPVAAQNSQHYALSAEQRRDTIQANRKGASGTKQVFYTVKSGDNLWTISRRYGVTSSKLAHWNGMSPRDTLRPGQKLSVWTKQTVATTAPRGQRDPMMRKLGYKVRNGDSLARIANKFNVSVKDIVRWNSVNPKKYLQPGQRLTLYVDIMAMN
jgi:membrane-bound lytic murein transglycosylase D